MPLCQFVIHTPQHIFVNRGFRGHSVNLVFGGQVFIITPAEKSFTGLVCLILVLCQLAAQSPVPANRVYHRPHARAHDSQCHNCDSRVQHQCGLYHTIHQQTEPAHNEEVARIPFKGQFLKIRHYTYSFQFNLSNRLHNVSVGIDVSSIILWICSSVDRYSSFRQRTKRMIANAHPPMMISVNTTLDIVFPPLLSLASRHITSKNVGKGFSILFIIGAVGNYFHNRPDTMHEMGIAIGGVIMSLKHTTLAQVIENHLIRFLQLHCSYLLVSVQPLYYITGQKSIVKIHKIAAKNL